MSPGPRRDSKEHVDLHLHLNNSGNYCRSVYLWRWPPNLATGSKVRGHNWCLPGVFRSNTTFTSVETNVEKKELGELKRVRLILIQGLSIILITLARTVASAVLPKLAENLSLDMRSLVNIINNCIELTSNSVHPLVYIIFSREAQKYAKKLILVLLRRKKAGTENTMDGILSDLNSTIIIS